MTSEKFSSEVKTLKDFFECFCKDKHKNQSSYIKTLYFKNENFTKELYLCDECIKDITYCFDRLQECPHEEKPRCRKCPTPCYEKEQWKKTAKIMTYSGIKLGLSKKFSKLFRINKS